MITDAQLRFSQNQAVTTGTQVSDNKVDLLSPNTNMGIGHSRRIFARVTTTFTGGTSIQAQYVQSANADLSSPDVLASGPVVLEANAINGAVLLDIVAPSNTKQYVGVRYVSVGTHGAGTVWAGVVSDTDRNPYLPANTGL